MTAVKLPRTALFSSTCAIPSISRHPHPEVGPCTTYYILGNKWPSRPRGGRVTKSQVCFQDKLGGDILIKCWWSVYQHGLPIHSGSATPPIWVMRGGDTTMKKLVIASCESCSSRRRGCYIIPGMVLRQCATSQDASENSTTYLVVRTVCMSSSYCTIQL